MRVRDVMRHTVVTVSQNATLREVIALLSTHRISGLPVLDDHGELVGVVTEHDVIRMLMPTCGEVVTNEYARFDPDFMSDRLHAMRDTPVRDFMSRNVVTAHEDDPVMKTAASMLIRKVRWLPVVKDKVPVGIVSRIDIAQAVLQSTA